MLERALIDYYRCPEEFVRLGLAGDLSPDAGYFRFGPETVCYGQTSSGSRARVPVNGLYDTLPAVTTDGGVVRVPFDPSEVIDNLRLERYASDLAGPDGFRPKSWQAAAYYGLRGLMPSGLRRSLQRTYFRDWKTRPFPRWPVDDTVERILERLVLLALRSQGISRLPFVWFWPDGAPSAVILTHDVETAAGLAACGWLMDTDETHGIRASFQIVPEGRYEIPPGVLDEIRRRGFEVNVHDLNHDGRLFTDHDEFRRRALRINEYAREFGARGFRSGVALSAARVVRRARDRLRHVDSERGAPRGPARRLLHRDAVLHRRDRRAAADDDPGLFALPRAPRLLQRDLEEPERSDHRRARPGELHRPSGLPRDEPGPARVPRLARAPGRASARRGDAGSPCRARWSAGGGSGAG